MSSSFFVPALAQFLQGPMDSAKVPAEVPEDSRVVRAHDLVLQTSDILETWLVFSRTKRSKLYHQLTMVSCNLPPYQRL